MPKKFKITEAQYNTMMNEGVTIQGNVDSTGKADISATNQEMSNGGIDKNKVKVEFPGTAMSGGQSSIAEHRVVTKQQLKENRLRYLKENSEVMTFSNFIKKLH